MVHIVGGVDIQVGGVATLEVAFVPLAHVVVTVWW